MTPPARRPWRIDPADVVLGTVRDEDRLEADRLLRDDPAFRAAVDRLGEAGDALRVLPAEAAGAVAPPALDLDAALDARPARTVRRGRGHGGRATTSARTAPVTRPATSSRDGRVGARVGAGAPSWIPRAALAGAAAVLLFGGGVLAGTALDGDPEPSAPAIAREPAGQRVALDAFGGSGPQRAAVVMPASTEGEMELRVTGARPSRAGEYYELWLLDGGRRTTPVGTFRVGADGTARVRFPLAVDPTGYRFLDVSVQEDNGDPTHSGRSVLRSAALS
jgi:anti-sigma-K factor RskA